MKKSESSNKYKNSRKISPSVSQTKLQETVKLRAKNSIDGQEQFHKTNKKSGKEKHEKEDSSSKNEITGKKDQNDIKKEFEVRSENVSEKESGKTGREKEQVDESDEVDSEKSNKEIPHVSWRRSYKGDAEIVP